MHRNLNYNSFYCNYAKSKEIIYISYATEYNFIKIRLINFESWFLRFLFNLGMGIFLYRDDQNTCATRNADCNVLIGSSMV